jgi:hypothetical protein
MQRKAAFALNPASTRSSSRAERATAFSGFTPYCVSRWEPANREARRAIDPKRSRLDARLTRMLAAANKRRPPEQPQLTLAEAKTLAKNLIGSALARAQAKMVAAPRRTYSES